ncbi:MAG TPA: TldD/PmbA family protein [Candidatus Acidoferrales bacterium]|nr:TldD/PmbA family protein [Candidatus Acidoferrales bacterium]
MSSDAALEIAERGLRSALAAGAREAEATCTIARRFSVRARDTEIDKLEQSTARGLSLRVFVGEPGKLRRATLSTSDLSGDGIEVIAKRVVAAAHHVGPDPFAGLPQVDDSLDAGDLEIDAADVASRSNDKKIEDALTLEREARAFDPHIDNSNGSYVADAQVALGFANSNGARASYRSTNASLMANPVGRDGEAKRTAYYSTAARSWAGCELPAKVARRASSRILAMFGAKPIPTQKLPVIFERDVACAVLGDIFAAVSAVNVAIDNSYLADKVGEKVGSDLLTIVDDGRLCGGMGTSPFDGEGVPTRRTVVFQNGVLKTHLFDTYYARKLGAKSTGNASGNGVGPNNFYLEPGNVGLEELIGQTKRGLLVLSIIGFATECASGTYSRGISGVLIEDGELRQAVDGVTIASNFLTGILPGIDALANDLRFDSGITAPSFRVAEMTVSGE